MSISRKNWSALSSLTQQWTMEDEEEVERERRRREKSSSSTASPDVDPGVSPSNMPTSDSSSAHRTESTPEATQGLSSVEQMQVDFVEMLRVRDEKRRMRHVETLMRQKEVGEDGAELNRGVHSEDPPSFPDEEQRGVSSSVKITPKSKTPLKISLCNQNSSSVSTNIANRQRENSEPSSKDPDPKLPPSPACKFVSSVSISLDKSPSVSGRTTPMSPLSPMTPASPREHWPLSPSPKDAESSVFNGHTQETSVGSSTSHNNFEQTTKPAFVRQSSRTISFRMMRKKEEDIAPLQRSASVRMTSKKSESNASFDQDQNEDEDKTSSFQRNSRQRISSRSIKEKMERLAQAAQKTETTRSPDVTQRTLFLLDEVSRKRGIFERDQPATSPSSPGVSRQEFRGFTSGMSDRINRWINKASQHGSSQSPSDLRHVDINSKRNLFESSGVSGAPNNSPGKLCK